jgi:hypothetical protein
MDWLSAALDVDTKSSGLVLWTLLRAADPTAEGVAEASQILTMKMDGWKNDVADVAALQVAARRAAARGQLDEDDLDDDENDTDDDI